MTRGEALEILGLDSDASLDEARAAYRTLAKTYHPDKNSASNATAMFRIISALEHWYELISGRNFRSIAEVCEVFPHADRVDGWTVFNIGGNTARLIAFIHYGRQTVSIHRVLTHPEYDRWMP